jgi:hypothetical protein
MKKADNHLLTIGAVLAAVGAAYYFFVHKKQKGIKPPLKHEIGTHVPGAPGGHKHPANPHPAHFADSFDPMHAAHISTLD